MDRGPEENGWHDPELASIEWREVVDKGWHDGSKTIPAFWRPAVRKALIEHCEQLHQQEIEERFGRRTKIVGGMSTAERREWLLNRRLKLHGDQMT